MSARFHTEGGNPGKSPPQLKSSVKFWPPLTKNKTRYRTPLCLHPFLPTGTFLHPFSPYPSSSPLSPSLLSLPRSLPSSSISLRLQCVFEEDLADVFDELTANLQVCAKNQGEKERKLNWREREKESGERKSRK